jgi:chemotaxis protein histidine kinase CheA/ActR/RegA family two-component response regulator
VVDPSDDLLPLFLAEAADRLDRLGGLLPAVTTVGEAGARARRELHALKGAGRMLGLSEFASLCHDAEALLENPTAASVAAAQAIHHRLGAMVARRLPGAVPAVAPRGDGGPGPDSGSPPPSGPPVPKQREPSLRLAPEMMDDLTDRGTRMRVLSVAGGGAVERLFRLAHLAERGVGERAPRQVLATLATALRQLGGELEAGQRRLQNLSEGLLEALLRQQMRPLRPVLESLAAHAQELAEQLHKEVALSVRGGDTLLDRRIIRALQEAFVHLVRNAVDHGIEPPEVREASGKPRQGRIRLDARLEGERVRLEVADDGRGMDPGAIAAEAVRKGELSLAEAEALDRDQSLQLLFRPGFTTRDEASEVSGRGIGLDAVAAAVRGMGGDLWLHSEPGRGSNVTVEVPVARRGERVLLLRVGRCQVAVAAAPVRGFRRHDSRSAAATEGADIQGFGDEPIVLRHLADLTGDERPESGTVVVGAGLGEPVAIVVDEVVGEEEVLVRPLPRGLGVPDLYEGMAVTGLGRPVAVLSWQRVGALSADGWKLSPSSRPSTAVRVLLADDSRVTREMIRRLLEDAGIEVTAVGSAEEALAQLSGPRSFDCLVTDIEMPGLDGLELTRKLRRSPDFADLPIIVVSTRDRQADHRAGLEAGADAYLSKQRLEARELVALVRRAGGVA